MAEQPVDTNLQNLVGISSELAKISDKYREIAARNKLIGKEVGNILQQSAGINRALNKTIDIEAKIGQEYIKKEKVQKAITEIEAERRKIQTTYEQTFAKNNAEAQIALNKIAQTQDVIEQLEREKSDAIAMGVKGYAKMVLISSQLEQKQKQLALLEADKSLVSINLAKEQLDIITKIKEETKTLTSRVDDANKSMTRANINAAFWQKLLNKLGVDRQKFFTDSVKFGKLGAGILAGVSGLVYVTKQLVDMMFKANQRITDISRGLNVSKKEALGLRDYFFQASNLSSRLSLTIDDIIKAQMTLRDVTGTTVIFSQKNLNVAAQLQDKLALSNEELFTFQQYSNISGKDFKDIRNTLLGTTAILQKNSGIFLDNRKIIREVLTATGTIRSNFKGSLEELTKGVTQARLLGTTLENVEKTTASLLDFESSISSELEAELLLGKQFNLERARSAALTNDQATVMQEIAKQAGSIAEFNDLNRIAQEGLAKAFGYTRGEMSDILTEYESITKLSKVFNYDTQMSLQQNFEKFKSMGKSAEEIRDLLGEVIYDNLAQQSASERFSKIVTKLQDVIGQMFDGGTLDKLIIRIGGFVEALSSGRSLFSALFGSTKAEQSKFSADYRSVNDSLIQPSGRITISTPEGMIVPNKKDSIITTTNPGAVTGTGNGEVVALLREIKDGITKGGNVYLDSRPVGTTQAMAYTVYA